MFPKFHTYNTNLMFNKQVLFSKTSSIARYPYNSLLFGIYFRLQHDGPVEDQSDSDSDDSASDESTVEANPNQNGDDEESLNSADDVSGTDGTEIFETGNQKNIEIEIIDNHFQKMSLFVNSTKFKE